MTTIEKTFALVFNQSDIGVWEIDIGSREINLCDKAKILFGFEPEFKITVAAVLNRIGSLYRGSLFEKIRKTCQDGGRFSEDIQIASPDEAAEKWLQISGKLITKDLLSKRQFVGTVSDITCSKLEEARRNDLIATISHEIKSPLTTIKLYIQLIEKITAVQRDEVLKTYLGNAVKEVDSIERLIEGFLDVSALAAGFVQIEKEHFEAELLLAELIRKFSSISPGHYFDLDCGKICVYADYFKIRQALTNLISNAVKYSPERSTISLSCIREKNFIQFSVTDQGFGISEANQSKLFHRYYRVTDEATRNIKGHGMGLYITRCIAEQHGGKVSVSSDLGRGSEFTIELPLR